MADKALIGAAGEHLELARLLSRGLLASPAPRGTEKVDIVMTDSEGRSNYRIQVKTTAGSAKGGWILQAKHESQADADLIYCLVVLDSRGGSTYVLPSQVVAQAIKKDHSTWLSKPARDGGAHKDSNMRRLRAEMPGENRDWLDQYFEAWHLLEK